MIYRIDESAFPKDRIYYTEIDHSDDIDIIDLTNIDEANLLNDVKQKYTDLADLKSQWKAVAEKFVTHIWIYRYIDEKQQAALKKHYDNLTSDTVFYSTYKRSFNVICKFMGLPPEKTIIENIVFGKNNKKDKEMYEVSVRYSKGCAKVKIPDGIRLIHVSPVEGIKELIPSFRSKVKGKYMYPNRRIFFTVAREIKPTHAGLEGKKTHTYTPKNNITTAYIDPTYFDFKSGSVYVETETPILVETLEKKLFGIFNIKKKDGENNV